MEKIPLVSIVIVTYNQSKFILETLESTNIQIYQNIELIISDDCSTDGTIDICLDWLENNKNRFVITKLIISPVNTGISNNLNRGINASTGKWIKLLAGDDTLPPYSITEYFDFVTKNKCEICCCKLQLFGDDKLLIKKNEISYNNYYKMIDKDWIYQKKMNARQLFIPGPGLFFSRDLFNRVGGFDEKYPFAEEWPFITKVLNNNKIYLLDKYLYNYRILAGSLSRDELGMNKRVFFSMRKYFYHEGIFIMLKNRDILYAWHYLIYYLYLTIRYNSIKKSPFFRCAKLIFILSPVFFIRFIKKLMISPPPP